MFISTEIIRKYWTLKHSTVIDGKEI